MQVSSSIIAMFSVIVALSESVQPTQREMFNLKTYHI